MVASEFSVSPYVGPRPFERGDAGRFFGRAKELDELRSLVLADRAVVLYAASGAGKTSLLNAGLVPLLEERGFEVLPPARPRFTAGDGSHLHSLENVYVSGLLSQWTPRNEEATADLTRFLVTPEHPLGPDGFAAPRAVVIDQLEELFFFYPERWREREGLFRQLADALDADPLLRLVLSVREDFLGQLDYYADLLGRLRTRCRLDRLRRDAALEAVTGPSTIAGRAFSPGVAERLVEDLLTARAQTADGETLDFVGEFVEPVQLQVVCHALWASLPPQVAEIGGEHVRSFGDVGVVLSEFYDDAIAAAARRAGMSERALRRRFESAFVTPAGTRATVYAGPANTGGVPNAAIDELEFSHVIRAEFRAGARWYELVHDRMIEPVRSSNRKPRRAIDRFWRR